MDLSAIGLQIVLPLVLIGWLAIAPLESRLGFALQVLTTGLVLGALLLVAVWIMPPWWTPYFYLALWLLIVFVRGPGFFNATEWIPTRAPAWAPLAVLGPISVWAALLVFSALGGRVPPPGEPVIDIAFPMGPGEYLIANGGAAAVINGHFVTLHPETERQRAYRGQSYGVDLVKLGPWGSRAPGWRPTDPTTYAIFGDRVYAPCSGTVRETTQLCSQGTRSS